MVTIKWGPEYSVGNEQLDEQHKKIISMINLLVEYKNGKSFHESVSTVLNEMTDYVKEHFVTEEGLMRKAGFPGLAQQEQEHRAFTKKVAQLCMEAARRGEKMYPELCDFLNEWLRKHIMEMDMQYKGKI